MKLVTGNLNKVKEWNAIMKLDHVELDLIEIQGTSEEIVKYKCKMAFEKLLEPCIVEDVGLAIDGMNGLPGPYIKSFLSMGLGQVAKLSSLGNGNADAVCMIGYHDGKDIHVFKGICHGRIVEPRGIGYGWDPIFEFQGKTFAEMQSKEKNEISHRKNGILQLKVYLDSLKN